MRTSPISHIVFALLLAAILTVLSVTAPAPPHGGQENDVARRVQALTERVTALEKLVVRDPFRPDSTLLARVEAIEKQLKADDRTRQAAAKADEQSLRQLNDTLTRLTRQAQEQDKRLKTIEQERRSTGGNELRQLQRDLDQMKRTIDDLRMRVSRLEARK